MGRSSNSAERPIDKRRRQESWHSSPRTAAPSGSGYGVGPRASDLTARLASHNRPIVRRRSSQSDPADSDRPALVTATGGLWSPFAVTASPSHPQVDRNSHEAEEQDEPGHVRPWDVEQEVTDHRANDGDPERSCDQPKIHRVSMTGRKRRSVQTRAAGTLAAALGRTHAVTVLPESPRESSAEPLASKVSNEEVKRAALEHLDDPVDEPSPAWAAQDRAERSRGVETAFDEDTTVSDARRSFVGQIRRRRRRMSNRLTRDQGND